MFEKLLFATEKERMDFDFYLPQRGLYVYKQVYDILLEGKESISYNEFSATIRYDKNLRYKLYEYFALFEENLRNRLLESYDVVDANGKPYKRHCSEIDNALISKTDSSFSNLYYRFDLDLGKLMDLCAQKEIFIIPNCERKRLKELRNYTMHHALLLFGHAHGKKELNDHLYKLEKQLWALNSFLPNEYQAGFLSALNKLNGDNNTFLSIYYVEATEDGIRIKK